ncbi:hypothetical protein [Clostridium sp.]|uniref:hypothetical protein n=1 Tax=Clostridium sp. TaxID=1506 RepID=UPI002636180E
MFTYVVENWRIVSTVELPENHVYKVLNKTLPKDKQVRSVKEIANYVTSDNKH